MKRSINTAIAVLLAALPQLSTAQWNMVRFDEINYFTKIQTITADAAISTGLLSQGNYSFIMRTNDAGITWDSLPLNVNGVNHLISSLHFTDVNNGFAGGSNGTSQSLLKTTDNAGSWSDITPDPSSPHPINGISFMDPLSGFASAETNIYKTTDGGNNWIIYTPAITIHDIGFSSMNIGYAGGTFNTNAVVKKTTNGGQTWNDVFSASVPFFSTSAIQKVDVISQDMVFASVQYSRFIYKTSNGGISWDTISNAPVFLISDFDFTSANDGHIVSSFGEIFTTSDGGLTWTLEYAVAGGAYGSIYLTSLSFAGNIGYVCGSGGLIKRHDDAAVGLIQNDVTTFSVHPNPLTPGQTLNIDFPEKDFVMEIYNTSGMLVKKVISESAVNLTGLPAGIYSARLTGNASTGYFKIILMK